MLRYTKVCFPFWFTLTARLGRAAVVATILLAIHLPGQAQSEQGNGIDPWEDYNRWMFNFNDGADRLIIKPVARGYDLIMPEVARIGVNNFFTNFYDFNGALNALLQGKIEHALSNTFRVVTNSTIGLFGLFDVASRVGIPRYETDFGHTLSIWGVPTGNYFMIPILGPSTVRNAFGASMDAVISPTRQTMNDEEYWGLQVLNVVNFRASLLDAEEVMSGDRYIFYRDVYLQNREALETGGTLKDDFSEFNNDWDEDEF